MAVQPDNPANLWAATSASVYRSKNGGVTWAQADGFDGAVLPGGGKRAFLLAPALGGQFGPGRAVVGTQSGAWATLDGGDHWGQMSSSTTAPDAGTPFGQRVVQSLGLGFSPPSLLAGTSGFGVFAALLQPVETPTATITPSTTLKAGTQLTASAGAAGTKPFFFTFVWRRCVGGGCVPSAVIAGATGATYTVPDEDAGKRVRYSVSATVRNLVLPGSVTDASPATADADVAPLAANAPRPTFASADDPELTPTTSALPTPKYGQTYTIDPGKWRTEGSSTEIFPVFAYRWSRCNGALCTEIPAATAQTYKAAPKDIGMKIRGEVTGTTGAGGSSAFFLAGESGTVVNKFPVSTVAPSILGDGWVGSTLTATAGGWDGYDMTYERRWLRCEADGLGCNPTTPANTTSAYVLTAQDRGKRMQVEVTAIGADPNQARRTVAFSAPSAVIIDPPSAAVPGGTPPGAGVPPGVPPRGNVVVPPKVAPPKVRLTVPKTLKLGTKLTVPAKVKGFAKVRYRWLRNGKAIKGATKRTYELVKADRGKTISCRIKLTRADKTTMTIRTKAIRVPGKLKR